MRNLRLRIYLSVKRVGLIYLSVKKNVYLRHIILKIYAQSWRNLKMYGNYVYSSGLATRNDLCFDKTNIQYNVDYPGED